jgi:subtilase family serine protease
MTRVHPRSVLAALALAAGVLAPLAVLGAPSGSAGASLRAKVALGQGAPRVPSDVTRVGPLAGAQVVHLDVALAGQDPSGLAAEVTAVSTPGSPDYHHYLTSSQFAATYGPTASEVAQVTAALRAEGLSVGSAAPGSTLLPVSGPASVVSTAFGTPLESIRLADHRSAFVNTASPQVPASLNGEVTGVVGLDGLAQEHSMILQGHATPGGSGGTSDAGTSDGSNDLVAHAGPQACADAATVASNDSGYTSTQLASIYGLSDLFGQGRTGIGQTIAIVEFEPFQQSDISAFQSCYGLSNPISTVVVDGVPAEPPPGQAGEAPLDIELAAANAPSASLEVYEAPNGNTDSDSLDLLNRIASDDNAQVVTTSWGICENDMNLADIQTESGIFARMASQGQTAIAAAGDSGSEDCFPSDGTSGLSIDDPGAQPDVVSAGGTTLTNGDVSSQTVWNDCQDTPAILCADRDSEDGAGGGGYSQFWSRPSWQPKVLEGTSTDPCGQPTVGCRTVPDISGSADPNIGGVAAYYGGWTVFGGTSAVAPSDAGLFADTNQGCYSPLGMAGPKLYAADSAANYTDVTSGNNDFTDTNDGDYAAQGGYDAATGLGTPIDQSLAIALQGADGCPSIAAMSAAGGPTSGGPAFTIFGGGLANATQVSFGSAGDGTIVARYGDTALQVVPPSVIGPTCVNVTITNSQGVSVQTAASGYEFGGTTACAGYRFVASDGGVFDFGSATFQGSTGNIHLNSPVVGMAATPSGNGYWLVAADGGVFTFGDAPFYGSMGAIHLNKPIVGMAAMPQGNGYYLVASDGGIFTFGSALFHGSMGGTHLNQPIVGMATTSDGGGYWLVAADGGIFTFGDAVYHGSTGAIHLNKPIVGMATTSDGGGYWLVASDGGIFTFGDALYHGSTGNIRLNQPVVGMAPSSDGNGYWLVASDGGIFSFGSAPFYGSTGNIHLNKPIVGMSAG